MEKEIHGYRLTERIGKGGFGEVWLAYQKTVGREVAIKVIMPKYANQPEFIRKFEMEARMVARLEHPFITPLFDYWREPQGAYLVMRLFRGGTLKQEMEQGPLPFNRVAEILENICSGLWTAHRNRVAHRDIKPANILIDDESRAYLSDFGLAIEVGDDHFESLVGTWLYMPPERIQNQEQTHTVDIYSLGIMTYQMVTGEYPFDRSTMKRLAQAHISQFMPPIQRYREDAPEALDTILQRATAKDPLDRYEDIRLFAQRFRDIIQPSGTKIDQTVILPKYEEITNPYLGLRPFSEADSMHFFGRHTLVNRLLDRLLDDVALSNFLALVGPSGSGKSSAIYAGLLPQLRSGVLTGSDTWYVTSMIPGSQPFQNLVLALRGIAVNSVDDITSELVENAHMLTEIIPRLLDNPDTPLLLFIDQFEEVFTQIEDESVRQRFLDLISATITANDNNIRIIITIRADFYDKPLRYEAFGKLMQDRTEVILPLDTIELERAIAGPAENVGLSVEPELIAEMISDVKSEPGALPLLQYTLMALFEESRGSQTLTLDTYRQSHGIRGALARRADEVYLGLSNDNQRIAEQVFLRLVTLGEGTEDTRRRTRYSELMAVSENTDDVVNVLNLFDEQRLLTFDRDPFTREPTVEVAHEALIREWQRFQLWLDNSRDDLRLQRMIASEVADWKDNQQDSSYLLRGNRLAQFEDWASSTNVVITTEELDYIQESIKERQHEEEVLLERQQTELELARRVSQRQRVILVLLLVVAIGGSLLMLGIIRQRDTAVQAVALSESSLQSAYSAALATTARQALGVGDYSLALSFAFEAVETDENSNVALDALIEIAYGAGITKIINPIRDGMMTDIVMSLDGSLVAGIQNNVTYDELFTRYLPQDQRQRAMSRILPKPADFSTMDYTQFPPPRIDLYDTETGEYIITLEGHTAPITSFGFVPPDDTTIPPSQLYSASVLGEVFIWDITSGEIIRQFNELPHGHNRLSITDDGRYLFASTGSYTDYADEMQLVLIDVQTGERIGEYPLLNEQLWDSTISPDGSFVLSAYLDALHVVWDIETGDILIETLLENSIERPLYKIDIGLDPERALTSMGSGEIYLWEIEIEDEADYELEAEEITLSLGRVEDISIAGDGSRMLILQSGGTFADWDIENETLIEFIEERGIEFISVDLDETGNIAAIGREDGSILIWDLTNQPPTLVQGFNIFDPNATATFLTSDALESMQLLVFNNYIENNQEPLSTLSIVDVSTYEIVREWETPHQYKPEFVIVDDTGQFALTADRLEQTTMPDPNASPKLIWWDLSTEEPLIIIEPSFPIFDAELVLITDDDPRAITGGPDGVYMWNLATGQQERILSIDTEAEIHQVAITPDRQYVFGTTTDGQLIQWEFDNGDVFNTFDTVSPSRMLGVYPPNNWVVASHDQNAVAIRDYVSGELINELDAHEGDILSVDFSSAYDFNFPIMITTGDNGEAIYWDTDGFQAFGSELFLGRVEKVEVASNPQFHLLVSSDGWIEISDVESLSLEEIRLFIEENRIVNPISIQDCILFNVGDLCTDIDLDEGNS